MSASVASFSRCGRATEVSRRRRTSHFGFRDRREIVKSTADIAEQNGVELSHQI